PIVMLVAAREGGNPDGIPNEDSRAFDLDDSNLFDLNRFSGLDRWEGGARATYGARWALLGKKFDLDVLIGQSYRFDEDSVIFPDGTGLSGNFSDIVGRVAIGFTNGLELTHRFRIDKNDLAIRRNEIEARIGNRDNALTVGYVKLNRDLAIEDLANREELRLSAQLRVSRRWMLTGGTIQDLSSGRDSISQSLGVIYQDECLEFRLNYRKNFTADRDFEPGTTITVNVKLRNLG
ncbi:MAG: LPS-assembly protein LptD, partial [Alphaproteobacteria bacterium]